MKMVAYNCGLVLAGLPVLGGAFSSTAAVHPVTAGDFDARMKVSSFGLLLGSLAVFALVWRLRARWLSEEGVYQTHKAFSAFLSEGHALPSASAEEVREFLSWIQQFSPMSDCADEFDPYSAGKLVFGGVDDPVLRRRLLIGLFGHLFACREIEKAA